MKKYIVVMFLVISSINCMAQFESRPGSHTLSLGYGTPNWVKRLSNFDFGGTSANTATGLGPIHFKYEYGAGEKFGIGLSIGYVNAKSSTPYIGYDPNTGNTIDALRTTTKNAAGFCVRTNYYLSQSDRVELFIGAGGGFNFVQWSGSDNSLTPTENALVFKNLNAASNFIPVAIEGTVGARVYLTDNIAIYMEGGYAKSLIQMGLSFRQSSRGGSF
jgi:hypothetical protein